MADLFGRVSKYRVFFGHLIVFGMLVFSSPDTARAYEGYGANAVGDTSNTTVHVTTLADSGAGSLRAALAGGLSNRTIVFDVGGTITLGSVLQITGHHITIDGFTAPSAVTISGSPIEIAGQSASPSETVGAYIIMRGLRFRHLSSAADDEVRVAFNAHDIVVDHNSFSGGGDSAIDVTEGAYNVTVSWNVMAPDTGGAQLDKATLIATGAYHVSYHHNLVVGHGDRNPLMDRSTQAYSSGSLDLSPIADIRCNVFWDFVIGTYLVSSDATVRANVVSNLYNTGVGDHQSNNIVKWLAWGNVADLYAYRNVSVPDSRGYAYAGGSSSTLITHTNSESNATELIDAGARVSSCPTDQSGRLAEWTSVKSASGLVASFADDTVETDARGRVTVPNVSVLNAAWNDPAQPASDTTAPAAPSGLVVD